MKKEDYLAKVSIFSYFRKKNLQRLAEKSRYFRLNIGDVIIREGESDGRFFILQFVLLSVSVQLKSQNAMPLCRIAS
jgi:hypothetical protein